MSSKALGKRPEIVETSRKNRPIIPQQAPGPRKLVIKNLRVNRDVRPVSDYFAQLWADLDAALTAIVTNQQPKMPFELMYKGTEDVCRNGEAQKLADMLSSRCKMHLEGEVYESIKRDGFRASDDNIALLRTVLEHWVTWGRQLRLLRSAFAYLDRSYLINKGKEAPQINDMGIRAFRVALFGTSRNLEVGSPGARVIAAVCELVGCDRSGDDRFDSGLLKQSIEMLRVLGVYAKLLEPRFLSESHKFLEEFARDRSENYGLKDYIVSSEKLLSRERQRSDAYNFDSTTKRLILDDAQKILIENYSFKLLNSGSIARLLDDNDVDSMKALYELLQLSEMQKRLKEPWQEYIQRIGESIVGDVQRGDEMIVRLLLLRRSLDVMVRDAFEADETFTYGLREAFTQFINSKAVNSAWNTGTSKVGEMIAKYIDMLLRGGLKTLPPTLMSDRKDRDAAEKSGVASTADEDAELDRQLDSAIDLFRFIEGKDVFEAFYKRDLARRLLMGRSASQDAERNMIAKLKSECGQNFTNNLEQMFRDQAVAKEEMDMYKAWREASGRNESKMDLNVTILAESAWPTYPDVQVLLPKEVLAQTAQFEAYYNNRQSGRKLRWKHNMAHAVVSARFNKGAKELMVSAFQAIVLVLFNEVEGDVTGGVLSYSQLAAATGLSPHELQRTLQSLACGKVRVLLKHPKGRDVNPTDTFTVNKTFWDPKFRVKINQIQLKETTEENKATHERVVADRQFETQAAIVRIMKARKTLPHAQLVAEVINQTKSRGAMDPQQIKTNIEKLIEKDYLERDGQAYTYLA